MDAMEYYLDYYKSNKTNSIDLSYDKNNYITNYLKFWYRYYFVFDKKDSMEIDKLWLISEKERKEFDYDTKFNTKPNDVYADSLISLWSILEIFINNNIKHDFKRTKNNKIIKENKENLEYLINYKWDLSNNDIKLLNELAKLISSKKNVISYDNLTYKGVHSFNKEKFSYSNDNIWLTLYKCFEGPLAKYFESKDLVKWITDNKLDHCFNGEVKKENIKNIDNYLNNEYIPNDYEDYIKYIKNCIKFIKDRLI